MTMQLNHFTIRSLDLPACERFYCGVLGLALGPRPPFPFPGLWFYAGDTALYNNAVVHIIGIDRNDPEGLKQYLGERPEGSLLGTGSVDHLAFFSTDLAQTMARLQLHGVPFRERTVPVLEVHQVFLDDPNGVVIEINFPVGARGAAAA